MKRREWMLAGSTTAVAAAALGCTAAFAQSAQKVFRIGFLAPLGWAEWPQREVFLEAMRERGWVEGRHFVPDSRPFGARSERIPALAAELVNAGVDLVIPAGTAATQAVLAATKTIPVVFFYTGDPVGSGFVQSLAAPGGNATGLGGLSVDLHGKQLSLLKEAIPQLTRVAVFVNSQLSIHTAVRASLDGVAKRLGVQLVTVELRSPDGLEAAFASASRERAEALLLIGQPFFYVVGERLVRLSMEHKLPAMLPFHELTQGGMLMAYGSRMVDDIQRLPYFIDRILKGAKPAELPVEQPQHFYLSVNLKTARALGLNLPKPLLLRADVLVE